MSQKAKDDKNRWRNKTVGFRMSPAEADRLNMLVATSGMSKQDYLIKRVLQQEITIIPNPRMKTKKKALFLQEKNFNGYTLNHGTTLYNHIVSWFSYKFNDFMQKEILNKRYIIKSTLHSQRYFIIRNIVIS